MTGAEHFRRAEALLKEAQRHRAESDAHAVRVSGAMRILDRDAVRDHQFDQREASRKAKVCREFAAIHASLAQAAAALEVTS